MNELIFADIRHLENRLRDQRDELRHALRRALTAMREQNYPDLAHQAHDSGDESVADLLLDVELAGHERELQELRDVDAALARVADGTFGRCIDCGDDIARRRLLTFPTAKRCLPCQRRHEFHRSGGTDASPSL